MYKSGFLNEDLEGARDVKRLLEDILFEKKIKIKEAAKRMNISSERLYKYINPHSLNNNFPAFLIPIFTITIGPELLRYLASEAGYGILRFPKSDGELREAVRMASDAMRECSEALETYLDAIEDDRVTYREMREIATQVTEAVEALLNLKMVAERMRKEG